MFTKYLAPAALVGVSAVVAAPWQAPAGRPGGHPGGHNTWTTAATNTAPPSSGQTAFAFPLSNGFPNIQVPSPQLTEIELAAHGTLPNGGTPSTLAAGDVTSFELIAFNELFEVAFFTSLIQNITNNVPGYETGNSGVTQFVLEALTAVQAQEQLHALGANGILAGAGQTPIQPCEYKFPSTNFQSAMDFARTFTDVVLGTLQDAQAGLNANGDGALVPLIGAVIGQEGEQNGYYRSLLGFAPSALPFLTRSAGPFAFSVLNQNVIVPKSCPNSNIIDLPIFGALSVTPAEPAAQDQELSFSFANNGTDVSGLSIVYINQQNLPIVEPLTNVQTNGDTVTCQASFPWSKFVMNGLTIAAVTNSAGPFTSADEVAAATLFGPGLIEVL